MYCRNCGHKLEEGDKFCSSCGAKTIVENDANVSSEGAGAETIAAGENQGESALGGSNSLFEPFDFSKIDLALGIEENSEQKETEKKTSPVEEFDWNIHTFPGMEVEKTEDIDFNWSMPVEEPEPVPAKPVAPAPEPVLETPVVKPEPAAPEKTEPIGFAARTEQSQTPTQTLETKPAAAPEKKTEPVQEPLSGLEERLFGDLDNKTDEARKQSEEMDKFFTFHKKNEEFQKLLDQEYEKIKSGNMLSEEMDTATMASEEKFATRKPDDPMEALFASEGVVKGYEPKPIETDVLERIEAAEAEKRAKEESARLVEEEKARARKEAEEKARQEAEERAKQEAEEKARQEAEERAKQEAEEKARQEAEERARKEAEAAAAEKAAKEAEEAARLRLEEDAKRAADAKAAQEAAEREQARMAARKDAMTAMKNMEAEEQRIKAETEAKLEEQAAKIQAEIARQEAEAAMLQAEAAKKEAEEARAKALADMQKAEQEKQQQEQMPEETPVKTKAVNKAEILAGMATATEMVERDRAFAAAEAAAKAKEEPEPIELPDFLGHLDETEKEAPKEEPAQEASEQSVDIFEELSAIEKDAPQPGSADGDQSAEDLLSLEDLLAEDDKEPEPLELAELDEPSAQEEQLVQEPAQPEPAAETPVLKPEEPETSEPVQQEEEPEEEEEQSAKRRKRKGSASSDTAEHEAVKQQEEAEDDEDDDEEEEETGGKGRIVLKICLVILIILLALEIAGVVIKVAAPNSEAAKFIDSQLNKVIQMVTGDDVEYRVLAAEEDIRTETIQDKTELIEAEMGKNKDGNIARVEYNGDLKFDPQKEYENTDINLTQELSDVTWYKDASDKQVYYDQAIVGAVIAYDSQRMNLLNYGDKSVMNLVPKGSELYKELKDSGKKDGKDSMKLLQIGEIRQAGPSYFVWVSEKIGGTQTKKIYEMTPEGEMMKLTASYEL